MTSPATQPTPTSLPELLTPAEVAAALKVSRKAIYRRIGARQLTIVRLGGRGGRVRIPATEVLRLIAESTVPAVGQAGPKPLADARARLQAAGWPRRRPRLSGTR